MKQEQQQHSPRKKYSGTLPCCRETEDGACAGRAAMNCVIQVSIMSPVDCQEFQMSAVQLLISKLICGFGVMESQSLDQQPCQWAASSTN